MIDIQKYNNTIASTWCVGCGNFGIHMALKKAFSELDIAPKDAFITFDIGCNGNGADKINVNAFKGLHGRSVPLAVGVKLANRKLTVIADIGDGGTLHEGIDHLIHAIRSNYDITILIHNNQNFALTTGQATATTQEKKKMYGLPDGRPEREINIVEMALSFNSTFVSRTYSGDIIQLTEILKKSIQHKGCSIVEVMQYCPTYNKEASPKWFQEHIEKIEKPFKTKKEAVKASDLKEKIVTGILYQDPEIPTYYDQLKNRKDMKTELIDEVKNFNINGLLEKFK
jgi:2-oxoglutarate/2-oxoacid ferredoxin oxidoreductase subunit beta